MPLGFFGLGLALFRNYRKRNEDVVYVKNKKAKKVAQTRLKKAKSLLDQGQRDPFYKEILNTQWSYLSDKLNIPKGELNKEKVAEGLQAHKIDEGLIKNYLSFINQCEFAQFAPGANGNELKGVYDQATDLINKIEGEFK